MFQFEMKDIVSDGISLTQADTKGYFKIQYILSYDSCFTSKVGCKRLMTDNQIVQWKFRIITRPLKAHSINPTVAYINNIKIDCLKY